jgi:hypothetical protein
MADERINDLRRELFGQGYVLPRVYVEALQLCTEGAPARVGVTKGETERAAYWLTGHVLGELTCHGVNDEDARIEGTVTRLAELRNVRLAVAVDYDDFTRRSQFGRVLTIEPGVGGAGGVIVLDASPRSATADRRQAIENFIGAFLTAYATA